MSSKATIINILVRETSQYENSARAKVERNVALPNFPLRPVAMLCDAQEP
jgi:hypothetical protein